MSSSDQLKSFKQATIGQGQPMRIFRQLGSYILRIINIKIVSCFQMYVELIVKTTVMAFSPWMLLMKKSIFLE